MTDRKVVTVFYDERVLKHFPDVNTAFLPGRLDKRIRTILSGLAVQWKYPEHPGRLQAVMELLNREPIPDVAFAPGQAATREQLARVHTMSFLDDIFSLRDDSAWLDVDTTAVSPGSVEAAEVAAGTAIAAVEAVMAGQTESAFALVRPPGHHAEPARARGFCLFNNVAVAAAHAKAVLGCKRVLILDWDVHHGNGTQDIFWADPDVMFIDLHRAAPFYPGTGALDDIGAGRGEGTTVNVPLPGGAGDMAYFHAMQEIVVPATEYFNPDLILVSAGFDAHWFDLAMNVSYEGFAAMASVMQSLARRHCDGRLVCVLEGGYNTESLSHGVHSVLKVLAGGSVPDPKVCGMEEVDRAAEFHRGAFTDEDTG
ncbi:histone deacetylase superfamily protein [Marinobacter lipolyticus SM19]|uniref:Histone deacetylase superfamily protein n=1 Tax=Marinobacter lipolyticus SM19 TaxID=1318628 RepID=R8B079_9GAMM|nr:histone deacetylase [Marinobacter lipolyticus]EON91978.1 histone deacetylase superfamily protein [Marinobacter lipolyticus SM19]